MTITIEEFLTRFHSISGITIGERRKNLFLLLNGIDRSKPNDLQFSQLFPRTPLEEKFKVETLLYFKRIPELLEVLKSENLILIERILSVGWFLDEAFQNITGEQLVTEIFPYISFNAKLKLLNKLPLHLKSTQQADAYFEAVERKYGFYLASKLIPGCGFDVIADCLRTKRFKFTQRQLLVVIKNNPAITEEILQVVNEKSPVFHNYKNVFLYLLQQDRELFDTLKEKYRVKLRFGWRQTNKFIQLNRQDVIENPMDYLGFLHNKQVVKSLNQDFKVLYRNLFPEKLNRLASSNKVFSIIYELRGKLIKPDLLFSTFKNLYGSELWDHEEYRSLKLLKILPSEDRIAFTKLELKPPRVSEEDWFCYLKTEISIPYFKKTISLTSNYTTRARLVGLLVETCHFNEDKVALLNMCNYMLTKHRNDNIAVRTAFLNALKDKFTLHELNADTWNVINELLQLFTLNKETFANAFVYHENYIHFCLKNNLPIKEYLFEWLQIYRTKPLNIIEKNATYEKQCLLMFGQLIPELYARLEEGAGDDPKQAKLREKQYDAQIMNFINCVIFWNTKYPTDPISIFSYPYAMNKIKSRIENEEDVYMVVKIMNHCLKLKIDLEERNNLLNLYINRTSRYVDIKIILWLIRHELFTIIENIETITRTILDIPYHHSDPQIFIWKFWRNYTHLEHFQKIVQICLSGFEENVKDATQNLTFKNSVIGLSYLMHGLEFQKFIAPYYPTELRAAAKTEEDVALHTIRKYIGMCLKNLYPASMALQSIFIFCKGDYLKLVQGTLYSCSGNTNEDKLEPFFNDIAQRAVSVRKHAMHLAFRNLNKEKLYNMLIKFMETDKNPSVRKFIFKNAFNFFVMNPEERSWELVKSNGDALDVDDSEAMEILMQGQKIAKDYIPRYIVFVWRFLNNLPDSSAAKERYKLELMNFARNNVISLIDQLSLTLT